MTVSIHSPAKVVQQVMINNGWLNEPATAGQPDPDWPAYVNGEPASPDNCVTIYDVNVGTDGRAMIDGEVFAHDGIMIRVRAKDNPTGWEKAQTLKNIVSQQVYDEVVTIDGHTYIWHNASKIGTILRMGKDAGGSKRNLLTLNFEISLVQLS